MIFFIRFIIVVVVVAVVVVQVQEEFGDHPGGECRYLTGNLSKYLASKYMETTSATELEEHVLKLYSKLNGYSQEEARLSYLDYVKSWKIYGSSYYFAEPQNNKSFPPEVSVQLQRASAIHLTPYLGGSHITAPSTTFLPFLLLPIVI